MLQINVFLKSYFSSFRNFWLENAMSLKFYSNLRNLLLHVLGSFDNWLLISETLFQSSFLRKMDSVSTKAFFVIRALLYPQILMSVQVRKGDIGVRSSLTACLFILFYNISYTLRWLAWMWRCSGNRCGRWTKMSMSCEKFSCWLSLVAWVANCFFKDSVIIVCHAITRP